MTGAIAHAVSAQGPVPSAHQSVRIDAQRFRDIHELVREDGGTHEMLITRNGIPDEDEGYGTSHEVHEGRTDTFSSQHMVREIGQHGGYRDHEHHRVLPRRLLDVHLLHGHPVLHKSERVFHAVLPQICEQHRVRCSTGTDVLRVRVRSRQIGHKHPHAAVLGETFRLLLIEFEEYVHTILRSDQGDLALPGSSPVPVCA